VTRLVLHPPAKINLGLRILRRRADGYHEIRTRLQSVDLCDELTVETASGGFRLSVEGGEVPDGPENLVLRAAHLARDRWGAPEGARFRLRKRIPAAAGLGGGSSDAAAALVALARIVSPSEPPSGLEDLAAELGSDVPFFLCGGLAFGSGRGELLRPLPDPAETHLAILVPPFASPTPEAYRIWDEESPEPRGGLPEPGDGELSLEDPSGNPHNDFERVLRPRHPILGEMLEYLRDAGALRSGLSGSGPALFGEFARREQVEALRDRWEGESTRFYAAKTLTRAGHRRLLGLG
jgi:4-diphosphocytidyl-2-C-methyl-D-erythritol kinase